MSAPRQLPLDLGHREALGRDDFLVAPCNADAVAWIDRWPGWTALVVHGVAGCGKSHLASVWQVRASAEILTPGQLGAAGPDATAGGRGLILDGAHWDFSGKKEDLNEAELLHLYNLHQERGGSLLIAASSPPARWGLSLSDLGSRLRAVPAVEIGPPDDALLSAVLVKHFADRQLEVGVEVISYLSTRLERSFDACRRVVAALDAQAMAEGRAITVPLARQVLGETSI